MRFRIGWFFAVAATAALLLGILPRSTHHAPPPIPPSIVSSPVVAPAGDSSGVRAGAPSEAGFGSRERLLEHYRKHGHEFGTVSAGEYLRLARELRDRSPGGAVLQAVRSDGAVTRFDRESGAFLAFERDGTIHTFFKPHDGEAYFRRQLARRGESR